MYLPSCGTRVQADGRRARGQDHVLRLQASSPSRRRLDRHFVSREQAPVALDARHAVGLEQRLMPPVMVFTIEARRFCICARSS